VTKAQRSLAQSNSFTWHRVASPIIIINISVTERGEAADLDLLVPLPESPPLARSQTSLDNEVLLHRRLHGSYASLYQECEASHR
jgi:hypothetical protein